MTLPDGGTATGSFTGDGPTPAPEGRPGRVVRPAAQEQVRAWRQIAQQAFDERQTGGRAVHVVDDQHRGARLRVQRPDDVGEQVRLISRWHGAADRVGEALQQYPCPLIHLVDGVPERARGALGAHKLGQQRRLARERPCREHDEPVLTQQGGQRRDR